MFYSVHFKLDSFTFETFMKHDNEDNKMKLSYDKELRATAVITLQLFHITS